MPSDDTTPATVWLIEDNAAYRKTVARVINGFEDLRCPREFANCEDALAALSGADVPDVILMDVGLPGMNGLEGIGLIRARSPRTRIIVLTVFEEDEKIFRAICAGASGYLLKVSPVEQIANGIREVLAGGASMSSSIAGRVLHMFSRFAPARKDYGLTDREREVLQFMVEGLIKKEIADRLDLSVHTVDSHLRSIYQKLEVNTRTGAVAKALRERLL